MKNFVEIIAITNEGFLLEETKKLFIDYQKELNENLCFQSFDEELKNPLLKYSPPKGIIFLAKYNSVIAGCIALQPLQNKNCEMKRLYVKPTFRKHHIGDLLVKKLIEKATELQYKAMQLDTLERLVPAINLYKKLGFTIVQPYYTNPLPNVVFMEKKL